MLCYASSEAVKLARASDSTKRNCLGKTYSKQRLEQNSTLKQCCMTPFLDL